MKALFVAALAIVVLVVAACGQAAPAPAPTAAPAAPAKAVEPTKGAPAQPAVAPAQSTAAPVAPTKAPVAPTTVPAAPAKKADFPEKGKSITMIVPWPAGGPADVPARMLAPPLEKELGTTIQIVNKAGASGQVGLTDLAQAKPDGYTVAWTSFPAMLTNYLDPERKAAFSLASFAPVAHVVIDPSTVAVRADSPYKTMKDLFDAAKAKPEQIKASISGIMSHDHLEWLQLQKAAGVKFAIVTFDGTAPAFTALMGGHIDVFAGNVGSTTVPTKSGQIRALAVLDKEQSKFLPGVPTLESQGHKIYFAASRGISAPAGTPKEIVDLMSAAIKRVMDSEDLKKKAEEQGMALRYMSPAEYGAYGTEMEGVIRPLMQLAK